MTLAQMLAALLFLGALLTATTFIDWPSVEALVERVAGVCYPFVDPLVRWLL